MNSSGMNLAVKVGSVVPCREGGSGEDTGVILDEKSFNLKTISQGDVGHFRENNERII